MKKFKFMQRMADGGQPVGMGDVKLADRNGIDNAEQLSAPYDPVYNMTKTLNLGKEPTYDQIQNTQHDLDQAQNIAMAGMGPMGETEDGIAIGKKYISGLADQFQEAIPGMSRDEALKSAVREAQQDAAKGVAAKQANENDYFKLLSDRDAKRSTLDQMSQPGFHGENYPVINRVQITPDDGGEPWMDWIKGLNKGHAEQRARYNYTTNNVKTLGSFKAPKKYAEGGLTAQELADSTINLQPLSEDDFTRPGEPIPTNAGLMDYMKYNAAHFTHDPEQVMGMGMIGGSIRDVSNKWADVLGGKALDELSPMQIREALNHFSESKGLPPSKTIDNSLNLTHDVLADRIGSDQITDLQKAAQIDPKVQTHVLSPDEYNFRSYLASRLQDLGKLRNGNQLNQVAKTFDRSGIIVPESNAAGFALGEHIYIPEDNQNLGLYGHESGHAQDFLNNRFTKYPSYTDKVNNVGLKQIDEFQKMFGRGYDPNSVKDVVDMAKLYHHPGAPLGYEEQVIHDVANNIKSPYLRGLGGKEATPIRSYVPEGAPFSKASADNLALDLDKTQPVDRDPASYEQAERNNQDLETKARQEALQRFGEPGPKPEMADPDQAANDENTLEKLGLISKPRLVK